MSILVTGGAGFIGSNFVLDWLNQSDEPVINLDSIMPVNWIIFRPVIAKTPLSTLEHLGSLLH